MSNQRRGYEAERKCVNALRDKGYIVFRSAASKGPFDVIAVKPNDILFVQVKRTKNPSVKHSPETLREMAKAVVPAAKWIRKELWCWVERQGWVITPAR